MGLVLRKELNLSWLTALKKNESQKFTGIHQYSVNINQGFFVSLCLNSISSVSSYSEKLNRWKMIKVSHNHWWCAQLNWSPIWVREWIEVIRIFLTPHKWHWISTFFNEKEHECWTSRLNWFTDGQLETWWEGRGTEKSKNSCNVNEQEKNSCEEEGKEKKSHAPAKANPPKKNSAQAMGEKKFMQTENPPPRRPASQSCC